MRTQTFFKKPVVFTLALMLAMLMAIGVLPIGASDVNAGEETTGAEEILELTDDTSIKIEPYEKKVIRKGNYALSVSTTKGYEVTTLDNGDGTVTAYAYKDQGDKLEAMNISLSGDITLRFFFNKASLETALSAPNSRMLLTIPRRGEDGDKSEQTLELSLEDFELNTSAKGERYLLSVTLAAAQQTDKVKFQIKNGDQYGRLRQYSVRDYADIVLEKAQDEQEAIRDDVAAGGTGESIETPYTKVSGPVKHMLNMGAMAQTNFEYEDENLANKGIYDADNNPAKDMKSNHVKAPEKELSNAEIEVEGEKVPVIEITSVDANLAGTVGLRIFIKYSGKSNLSATVHREGLHKAEAIKIHKCNNAVKDDYGATHYVTISNIVANMFDVLYELSFTDSATGTTATAAYSVLNYIQGVLDSASTSQKLKDTVSAMYMYYVYMKEYIDNVDVKPEPTECTHERTHTDVKIAATCTAEGKSVTICSDCGEETATNVLPKLEHNYLDRAGKTATCSTYGWDAYKECSNCGHLTDAEGIEITKVETFKDNYHEHITKVDAKEATCIITGWAEHYACEDCGETFDAENNPFEVVIDLNPDKHGTLIEMSGKAATCLEDGYEAYSACPDCGWFEDRVVISKENGTHVAGGWYYYSDNDTTTNTALLAQDCTVCKEKQINTKPAYFTATLATVAGVEAKASFEEKYTYDTAVTLGIDGTVEITGSASILRGINDVAYQITDDEGTVLKAWTAAGATVKGTSFSATANVGSITGSTNVTFALIPKDDIIDISDDRYIPFLELTDVKAPTILSLNTDTVEVIAGEDITFTIDIKNNPGFMALVTTVKPAEGLTWTLKEYTVADGLSFTDGTNLLFEPTKTSNYTEDGTLITLVYTVDETVEEGEYAVSLEFREACNYEMQDVEMLVSGSETVKVKTEEKYAFAMEYINGVRSGGVTGTGTKAYYNQATGNINGNVTFTGWFFTKSGVESYEYSLNGGETWLPITSGVKNNDRTDLLNHVTNNYPYWLGTGYETNAIMSSMAIDVSEYHGSSVTILLRAITKSGETYEFLEVEDVAVGHYSKTFEGATDNGDGTHSVVCDVEGCTEKVTSAHKTAVTKTESGDSYIHRFGCTYCDYAVYEYTIPKDVVFHDATWLSTSPRSVSGKDFKDCVTTTLSDDRSYVRFERKGVSFADGNMMLLSSNTQVTGQYVVIKYRTDHSTSGNFWANTTENGHSNGKANFSFAFSNDEQWHIIVYDLAAKLATYVKPDADGDYIIQWSRFDMLDATASTGYIDLAWIMFCSDLTDAQSVVSEADQAICAHEFVDIDENCTGICSVCGKDMGTYHEFGDTVTEGTDNKVVYDRACTNCGLKAHTDKDYSMTINKAYKPNLMFNATNLYNRFNSSKSTIHGISKSELLIDEGIPFVRIYGNDDSKEPYIQFYTGGTEVSGKYLVYKYRLATTNSGNQPNFSIFTSTTKGSMAAGDSADIPVTKDGKWHTVVVDLSVNGSTFTANEAGEYIMKYIRMDFFSNSTVSTDTFDIAFVAVCEDSAVAANVDPWDTSTEVRGHGKSAVTLLKETGNLYFGVENGTKALNYLGTVTTEENGLKYVKIVTDAAFNGEKNTALFGSSSVTMFAGKYVGILYMAPAKVTVDGTEVANKIGYPEFFIHSTATSAQGGCNKQGSNYVMDGKWHLALMDVSNVNNGAYTPEKGMASLRFDYLNGSIIKGAEVNIAGVMFFDSLEEAYALYNNFTTKYQLDCAHAPAGDYTGTGNANEMQYTCKYCGETIVIPCTHNKANDAGYVTTGNVDEMAYTCTICNATVVVPCDHATVTWAFVTDNDDATTTAIMDGTCSICGKVTTRKTAPFLASLSGVSGAESYWAGQNGQSLSYGQTMYTYTTGALGYPTEGTLATSDDFKIGVFGWAGTIGESSGLKYRVVDGEGAELVGWSDVSGTWNLGDAPVQNEVTKNIGADGKGYYFDVTADLSEYVGKTVDVIFALVAANGVGNDNLIPFITIDNVFVPNPNVCYHENTHVATEGDNMCDEVCDNCLEVITADVHIDNETWVPVEGEAGYIQTNCTLCGTGLNKKACEHESTTVAIEGDNMCDKICNVCGIVVAEDVHIDNETWVAVEGEAGYIQTNCTLCGTGLNKKACEHTDRTQIADLTPAQGSFLQYTGTCQVCNGTAVLNITDEGLYVFTPDMLVERGTEPFNASGKASVEKKTENGLEYVHFEITEAIPAKAEKNYYLNTISRGTIDNAGQYFGILYRASKGVSTTGQLYISKNDAIDSPNGKTSSLYNDGEWRFVVFDHSANTAWQPENGTGAIRWDMFNAKDAGTAVGEYVDVAFAGFFTSFDAAHEYHAKFADEYDMPVEFKANFDARFVTADGVKHAYTNAGNNKALVADFSDVLLYGPNGGYVSVGGWCVVAGGVDRYDYRILDAEGNVLATKTLNGGGDCGETNGILTTTATTHLGTNRGLGASFQTANKMTFAEYAGQTINVEIVAVPNVGAELVIGKINNISVPKYEIYLSPAKLASYVATDGFSNFSGNTTTTVAEDNSYVRIERTAEFGDGYLMFLSNNSYVTGQYMVYKYRTDHSTSGELWANTVANGHDGGKAQFSQSFAKDKGWRIIAVDLAAKLPTYVQADENGKYTVKWGRMDILNQTAATGYFDFGWVMYCDDLTDVQTVLTEEDQRYCSHGFTETVDCVKTCKICGMEMIAHTESETYTDEGNVRTYTVTCTVCNDTLNTYSVEFGETKPELFLTATDLLNKADGQGTTNMGYNQLLQDDDGTAYVRLHAKTSVAAGEGHFSPISSSNTAVTGQYVMIKYRTTCDNSWEIFTGAKGTTSAAAGWNFSIATSTSSTHCSPIVADGEWQYMVIDLATYRGDKFLANDDGTYTASHFRWDIFNTMGQTPRHIDVAFFAMADDLAELEVLRGVTE